MGIGEKISLLVMLDFILLAFGFGILGPVLAESDYIYDVHENGHINYIRFYVDKSLKIERTGRDTVQLIGYLPPGPRESFDKAGYAAEEFFAYFFSLLALFINRKLFKWIPVHFSILIYGMWMYNNMMMYRILPTAVDYMNYQDSVASDQGTIILFSTLVGLVFIKTYYTDYKRFKASSIKAKES